MVLRQLFSVEHIERGSGDHTGLEHRDECGFIDDRTARGVDKPRRRFQQCQFSRTDKPPPASAQDQMDRDKARLS
jgi:hypothetical protein